jgi:hypothetical protein
MNLPYLASDTSYARFIQAFEQGTLPRAQWTHAAHLAVAYLLTLPEHEALDRMRSGIRHYNECVGTRNTPDSGYHETLTRFWLRIVSGFLRRGDASRSRLEQARGVVEEFGTRRDLYRKYYSFDVVQSRQARRVWMAPDTLEAVSGTRIEW